MTTVHISVWNHVCLVIFVLGAAVMAQNSSLTIAPSSEFSMHSSSLSTQTFTDIVMTTRSLASPSPSALVTGHPMVSVSSTVNHGMVSSSVHTIQPTATLAYIADVNVKSSSMSNITSAASTEHLVMTSSISVGGSVTDQHTVDTTTSVATPDMSSQVMSSSSASSGQVISSSSVSSGQVISSSSVSSGQVISSSSVPIVSVSLISSTGYIKMDESMISPVTSQDVAHTQVTALLDGHSTTMLTPPLPSTTSAVSGTVTSNPLYMSGSDQTSTVSSVVLSSSSSSAAAAAAASLLSSSFSPSSVAVLIDSSSVIGYSPMNSTVEQTITESVTKLPVSNVSFSVPISSSALGTKIISSPSIAQVQSSSSHMASAISSSSSTQEAFHMPTPGATQETLSTSSYYVMTMHTKSDFLSTSSLLHLDTSDSRMMQSSRTNSMLAMSSSSVVTSPYTSSRQEHVTPSAASVQTITMTSTATTHTQYVTDHSTSSHRPSTSVMAESLLTSPQPTSANTHIEPSTSVVTPPESSPTDHSTSVSPKHSISPWLPTLIARNISFEIEFSGVCNPLVQKKIVLEIFWEELVITLAKTLHIDNSDIKPKDIACRPIRISFLIMETTRTNVTQILKALIDNGEFKFKIPVIVGGSESKYQYEAVSVKQVPLAYDITGTPDLYEIGLNKVDIIVIIVACCVSFILICIGCCICLREYYIRKRSRSFDLSDIVNFNLKLEDYTLTKIPRNKPFYSDNAVKMQSFTRKNGQQTKSLLEQEEHCNYDDVNVNRKEVKVRMNSHSDGIVIGVTATSIPDVVTNHHRAREDQTDQSKEILFANESSPTHCMDNPIYFADDDRFTAV